MTPDNSLTLAEKHHLTFPVLSDAGLKVASQFGLVYHVPLELKAFFQSGGLDLAVYNGDGAWRLPRRATYVTDHDGIVVARVNADWRDRLDPLEIYSALQKIT
jgi:peroxiredoxin